jgi:hypothetical protein
MIHATCHTDDFLYDVAFDATPWFLQASDNQILALAAIDWGGDYAADEVALFTRHREENLKALFDYLDRQPRVGGRDAVGFECHVDGDEAEAWLRQHRPTVHARLTPTRPPDGPSDPSPARAPRRPWGRG